MPDGRTEWVEVAVTDQKRADKRKREFEKQQQLVVLRAYAATGAGSFGISLISLPIPLFMLRTKEKHNPKFRVTRGGCVSVYAYTCGWLVLSMIVIGTLMPLDIGEVFVFLVFFIISYAALVAIAFDCSRRAGFRLDSPQQFSRLAELDAQKIDSE